jgi:hypothetical protein
MNFNGMSHCHVCGEAWLAVGPTSKEKEIAVCVEAIRATADLLKNWQETLTTCDSKGFFLALEIKSEDPEEA